MVGAWSACELPISHGVQGCCEEVTRTPAQGIFKSYLPRHGPCSWDSDLFWARCDRRCKGGEWGTAVVLGEPLKLLFLPPSVWRPPADRSSQEAGEGLSFITLSPLPPVSPEGKKRGSTLWTSSWSGYTKPGSSLKGQNQTNLQVLQRGSWAWPCSPLPFG